jgi:hypothetical protein
MASSMSTPLTNIPLKSQQAIAVSPDNNDLQDPMVQDVLKEFEEEVAAAKKINPTNQYQRPQQPAQQQQYQQQYQQSHNVSPPPVLYNSAPSGNSSFISSILPKNNLIDSSLGVKAIIITILVVLLNYTQLFPFIYEKLPDNISSLSLTYDFYIKTTILFLALYVLFLYEII